MYEDQALDQDRGPYFNIDLHIYLCLTTSESACF